MAVHCHLSTLETHGPSACSQSQPPPSSVHTQVTAGRRAERSCERGQGTHGIRFWQKYANFGIGIFACCNEMVDSCTIVSWWLMMIESDVARQATRRNNVKQESCSHLERHLNTEHDKVRIVNRQDLCTLKVAQGGRKRSRRMSQRERTIWELLFARPSPTHPLVVSANALGVDV